VKDKNGNPTYTPKTDWRCTTKPGKLYITLFKWPSGSFALDKVKGKVKKAYLLTASKHELVKVKQEGEHVSLALPAAAPGKMASVVVLEQ
jgi:alpha-L-fucosidase